MLVKISQTRMGEELLGKVGELGWVSMVCWAGEAFGTMYLMVEIFSFINVFSSFTLTCLHL